MNKDHVDSKQTRREFLKKTGGVTTGIIGSLLLAKLSYAKGEPVQIGKSVTGSDGPQVVGQCGVGMNCSGGGGQCGVGMNCAGDGGGDSGGGGRGQCGVGMNCSGGGGQCGVGMNCGGS